MKLVIGSRLCHIRTNREVIVAKIYPGLIKTSHGHYIPKANLGDYEILEPGKAVIDRKTREVFWILKDYPKLFKLTCGFVLKSEFDDKYVLA